VVVVDGYDARALPDESNAATVGRRKVDKGATSHHCPVTGVRGGRFARYRSLSANDESPVFHPSNFSSGLARAHFNIRRHRPAT
jgi:hypothetical protein